MGQKQSSSLTDSEMDMTNRTDLTVHFTSTLSRTYQPDECIHCGACLEDNCLFNSSGVKSSGDISAVRCRECRVCQSTNVILVKFRPVLTSSPRSFRIHPTINAQSQPFRLDDNHNKSNNQDDYIVTELSHNGGASTGF